jgi:hypothetical protein
VFGCPCWPHIRPYNTCKLEFRSKRCVFLGYSSCHKGYKCLDVATGQVYICRDVVFDENIFPFSKLHSNARAQLCAKILLLPPSLRNFHGDAVVAGHRAHGANPVVEYVVVHAEEVTNLQEEEHGAISESAKDAENVTDPVATVNPGADPGESASD